MTRFISLKKLIGSITVTASMMALCIMLLEGAEPAPASAPSINMITAGSQAPEHPAFPVAAPVRSAAAAQARNAAASEPPQLSGWDKKWWIEKTSRLLRGGEGIDPFEDMDALASLPKREIAKQFMEDDRFGETVLDFNMYFLGFKVDQLKTDGAYVFEAYDFANAVNAAKAVMNNGDYLTLFNLEGAYYLPPLSEAPTEDKKSPEDAKLSPSQLRQKAADELIEQVDELIEQVDNPSPPSLTELCEVIEEFVDRDSEISAMLYRAFTDEEIFVLGRANIPNFLFDDLQQILGKDCQKAAAQNRETDAIENKLWTLKSKLSAAFQEIFQFEPAIYGPDKLTDLKPLNIAALPVSKPWPVFGYKQAQALANSSTNHNRKRSAYMLKRFFCDDLTPVGFDMPQEHTSGQHGSKTSCFSCHHKLDPMAGFFRNYGSNFSDVSGEENIVFDDSATMPLKTYLKSWRGPEAPDGTWEIGYIRSARWREENDYGHTLANLTNIIRRAPEAKRCLMKRLTQYMLGENQTVDGGYLDALTEDFKKQAKVNSSQALKNAMISILESKTFEQRNPNPRECYDLVSRTVAGNRPPCRIAYILEKNCVQCHNSSMARNQLDLTIWNAGPKGASPNFRHYKDDGQPVSASETLAEIAKRLSSSDPDKRMPKNMTMSSQERQELFLWTQEMLSAGTASQ